MKVTIVGGSGYVGGELLRLLLAHPNVEVQQITSEQHAGKYVYSQHPNLRGRTKLQFTTLDQLAACDLLFLALPHGQTAKSLSAFTALAHRIIDLSADFRLRDATAYRKWYGWDHPSPDMLSRFVYGLVEFHREEIKEARWISGVGCNATATNLALWPLARRGLIERAVVEVKVGSSEGGNQSSAASHHPERSGTVRSFAPTGHRHQAEIEQELGSFELHFSATAVELVRGVLCTAHAFLKEPLIERDIWKIYRDDYGQEPFIRLVKDRTGIYRYPEPKILAGTNYADIGFEIDQHSNRVVLISAIDNLMKGAAGTAVQAMNLMCGWQETLGLDFAGLHPI
ncbi:MAG: N-acetyl-gamma-glutamyl-phosphate reductase [Blastocatellia bacterium]|nr:N-acetyl-gamma-glutamyl-phosphate reductase [Blastocatellia bacterium]